MKRVKARMKRCWTSGTHEKSVSQAHHQYGAFTLIELLVVVAIIVILIAILVPSLSRAREQSKAVKCGTQLRQIGVGMYNYASENEGRLPPPRLIPAPVDDRDFFLGALWTYVGYQEKSYHWQNNRLQHQNFGGTNIRYNVFNCPVTARLKNQTPTATGYYSNTNWSYGVNSSSSGYAGSMMLAHYSPQMVALLESSNWTFNWTWPWIPSDGYSGGLLPHLGATNALFLDGHVELRKYNEIPYHATMDSSKISVFWKGF